VKYLLLAYTHRKDWDEAVAAYGPALPLPEAVQRGCDVYEQLERDLAGSGEFLGSLGLDHPSHSRVVSARGVQPLVLDGPFAEAKEVLVSVTLVEVPDVDRAVEIAARIAAGTGTPSRFGRRRDGSRAGGDRRPAWGRRPASEIVGPPRAGRHCPAVRAVRPCRGRGAGGPDGGRCGPGAPATCPDEPLAWLCRVAQRRLTDMLRSEQARQRREERDARLVAAAGPRWDARAEVTDDSLVLLLMCCHPVLAQEGQVALTLRALGGLTTEEIARAFHVPLPTMGQRISRAKQQIKRSGVPFRLPPPAELGGRLTTVQQVLYLIFNEGYAATSGEALQRLDLSDEAIRLARMVLAAVPDDGEAAGLLALMLLAHARRHARTGPDGDAVPLLEQDRSRWDRALIDEGVALLTGAMTRGAPGPYQLQAAIAAVHDEAASAADTDWPQICALYALLDSRKRQRRRAP
jgi:hypothetical protein